MAIWTVKKCINWRECCVDKTLVSKKSNKVNPSTLERKAEALRANLKRRKIKAKKQQNNEKNDEKNI